MTSTRNLQPTSPIRSRCRICRTLIRVEHLDDGLCQCCRDTDPMIDDNGDVML